YYVYPPIAQTSMTRLDTPVHPMPFVEYPMRFGRYQLGESHRESLRRFHSFGALKRSKATALFVMGSCLSLPKAFQTGEGPAKGAAKQTTVRGSEPKETTLTGKASPSDKDTTSPNLSNKSTSRPKFVYNEHSRRFHNEENAVYPLSNDEDEISRLQEIHYFTRWILEGDFHAPVKDLLESGANVLDVGCGPGTWTLEMATNFTNSHFTGIDMSAIFPETIRPQNCTFQECNVLNGLSFPDNHFDFVYQRYLVSGYTSENWPYVLKEIKRVTKAGGWVELVEVDVTSRSAGSLLTELNNTMIDFMKAKNVDLKIGKKLPSLLEQCSDDPKSTLFADFRSTPINWGGRVGDITANQTRSAIGAVQSLFEPTYGKMTPEAFKEHIDKTLQEATDFKAYYNTHFGYVQVNKA
ncbi:hypothetical protein BZG36_05173, partial [Bifiguratus adelaidae]